MSVKSTYGGIEWTLLTTTDIPGGVFSLGLVDVDLESATWAKDWWEAASFFEETGSRFAVTTNGCFIPIELLWPTTMPVVGEDVPRHTARFLFEYQKQAIMEAIPEDALLAQTETYGGERHG